MHLALDGELTKNAVSEGTKAVTKYTSSSQTGSLVRSLLVLTGVLHTPKWLGSADFVQVQLPVAATSLYTANRANRASSKAVKQFLMK